MEAQSSSESSDFAVPGSPISKRPRLPMSVMMARSTSASSPKNLRTTLGASPCPPGTRLSSPEPRMKVRTARGLRRQPVGLENRSHARRASSSAAKRISTGSRSRSGDWCSMHAVWEDVATRSRSIGFILTYRAFLCMSSSRPVDSWLMADLSQIQNHVRGPRRQCLPDLVESRGAASVQPPLYRQHGNRPIQPERAPLAHGSSANRLSTAPVELMNRFAIERGTRLERQNIPNRALGLVASDAGDRPQRVEHPRSV